MTGIDVSKHNGEINWEQVGGVDFAIIRAGYGRLAGQRDTKFEANYQGAKNTGLHVGAYWYSYAKTADEAIAEARACLEVIKGKQFDMPIYFDIEEKSQAELGKKICSDIVKAFCGEMEKAGYWVGVYSYNSFFKTNFDESILTRYATWIARVPTNDDGKTKISPDFYCGMHQYSFKGTVSGIVGDVDMDECVVNYPESIKASHLNGYGEYDITAYREGLSKAEYDELAQKLRDLEMVIKGEQI